MPKSACILGCGPAGLLAAEAARQEGYKVSIYSVKEKSKTLGAQYIHEPIPEVTSLEPDGWVTFTYWGSREQYAEKVYGDPWSACSWGTFKGKTPAWSMQSVYDGLWQLWEQHIRNVAVKPQEIALALHTFDLVVCTIPLPSLCQHGHSFPFAHIWAAPEAPKEVRAYEIIYNGLVSDSWYRASWLFWNRSTEWPGRFYDEASGGDAEAGRKGNLVPLRKPLGTSCDCHPGMVRAGRFGTWSKGVLAHSAYYETREAIRALY